MNRPWITFLPILFLMTACQHDSVKQRFDAVYLAFADLDTVMIMLDGTFDEAAIGADSSRRALSVLEAERELAEAFAEQSIKYADSRSFVCLEWSRRFAPRLYETVDKSDQLRVYLARLGSWGSDSWLRPKLDRSTFVFGPHGMKLMELLQGDTSRLLRLVCNEDERLFDSPAFIGLHFRTRDMIGALVLMARGKNVAEFLGDLPSRNKVIEKLRAEIEVPYGGKVK